MPPSFPHRGSSDLDPVGAPHGRDGPHALVCRAHGALLRHPVRPCAGRTGTPMPSSPSLDPDALAHSAHLQALIREQIAAAGGAVPFSRFMELALYAPGLGYYSAGATKFGLAGDFVTAPALGSLFAAVHAGAGVAVRGPLGLAEPG